MSPWLVDIAPATTTSTSRTRIVVVPYAGGGVAAFRSWRYALPDDVSLQIVRLPGRESRFNEPAVESVVDVVDAVAPQLPTDLPLVLFGYSLGAIVAFELAARLPAAVTLLAVGGADAPQVSPSRPPLHDLDEPEFLAALRSLGGTPDEVLDHPELRALVLPVLRADFALLSSYKHAARPLLRCPVATFCGTEDPEITTAEVARWSELTTAPTTHRTFVGDHFFFAADPRPLITSLLTELNAALRDGR